MSKSLDWVFRHKLLCIGVAAAVTGAFLMGWCAIESTAKWICANPRSSLEVVCFVSGIFIVVYAVRWNPIRPWKEAARNGEPGYPEALVQYARTIKALLQMCIAVYAVWILAKSVSDRHHLCIQQHV